MIDLCANCDHPIAEHNGFYRPDGFYVECVLCECSDFRGGPS